MSSQLCLIEFVGAELDGGVGHDPEHGGRVAPPQAEQAVLHVGAADEPEGLLRRKGTYLSLRASIYMDLYLESKLNSPLLRIFWRKLEETRDMGVNEQTLWCRLNIC